MALGGRPGHPSLSNFPVPSLGRSESSMGMGMGMGAWVIWTRPRRPGPHPGAGTLFSFSILAVENVAQDTEEEEDGGPAGKGTPSSSTHRLG